MSGEERLPEEQWIRGDDPTKSSSPKGSEVSFEFQRGVMTIEIPQNEEISVGKKDRWRKGVDSAIRQRRANRGSIHIKEREQGGDADPT